MLSSSLMVTGVTFALIPTIFVQALLYLLFKLLFRRKVIAIFLTLSVGVSLFWSSVYYSVRGAALVDQTEPVLVVLAIGASVFGVIYSLCSVKVQQS